MSLVADPIGLLLGGGAVVAQAIGLDDQAEDWPEEVHPEAVDRLPGERLGKPGSANDPEEAPFELGVGEGEGRCAEDLAKGPNAALIPTVIECATKRLRIDEIELVGFVY